MINKNKYLTGKVDFYNRERAFGFVKSDGSGKRYFFHITNVVGRSIQVKDSVTFDLQETDRGIRAINVQIL